MLKDVLITVDREIITQYKGESVFLRTNEFEEDIYKTAHLNYIIFYENSMYFRNDGEIEVISSFPFPTKEMLLEIMFEGNIQYEIFASAFLLNYLERTRFLDFRQDVVERLEKIKINKLSKKELIRCETIIYSLDMENAVNRRDVIGKTYEELEKDSAFYLDLGNRIFPIVKKLNFRRKYRFFMFR